MSEDELPAWLTAGYEAMRRSGTNVSKQPTYVIPGWMADQYGGVDEMNATVGAEVFVVPDSGPVDMADYNAALVIGGEDWLGLRNG